VASTESVSKALAATNSSIDTFVQLIGDTARTVQSVPLLGFAQAGAGGYFDDGGSPPARAGTTRSACPRSMTSTLMPWKFPATDEAHLPATATSSWCRRARPIRRGDRVVVKTTGGEVMVKELKRRTAKTLELQSLNPNHVDRTLAAADVAWIARIVWASQ